MSIRSHSYGRKLLACRSCQKRSVRVGCRVLVQYSSSRRQARRVPTLPASAQRRQGYTHVPVHSMSHYGSKTTAHVPIDVVHLVNTLPTTLVLVPASCMSCIATPNPGSPTPIPDPQPRPPTPDPRPPTPTPDPRPPTPDPRPTHDPRPPTPGPRPPAPNPRPPTPDPRPPTPDPRPPTPDPRPPTPDPGNDLAALEGHASKQQPIHLSKYEYNG